MSLQCIGFAVIVCVLFLSVHPNGASRVLEGEEESWMQRTELVLNAALPRGPVPPSGPSGCTNIPGNNGPACPITQMNFAGNTLSRVTGYPHVDVQFGVATGH